MKVKEAKVRGSNGRLRAYLSSLAQHEDVCQEVLRPVAAGKDNHGVRDAVRPMPVPLQAVRQSIGLLDRSSQIKLTLVTVVQMCVSALDLIGVALLGATTALAVASATGGSIPQAFEFLTQPLNAVGIDVDDSGRAVLIVGSIAGGILILKSCLSLFFNSRLVRFLAARTSVVSGRLISNLMALDLTRIHARTSQQTAFAVTTGVEAAVLLVLAQATIAAAEVALLAFLLLGLVAVSPVVALFALVFFLVVAVLIDRLLSRRASEMGARASDFNIGSTVAVQEALRTFRESHAGSRRYWHVQRIQGLRQNAADVNAGMQFINLVPRYSLEIAIVVGAALLAGSQLALRGPVEAIAVIVIFLTAGTRIVPSILRLQSTTLGIRQAYGAARHAIDLKFDLDRWTEHIPQEGADDEDRAFSAAASGFRHDGFVPKVVLERATFSYSGAHDPALNDVSLTVEPGTSVAIVGPTGAGKTTLVDVILGVLPPASGIVRVADSEPARAISNWPGAIAYVPQEVGLVAGSVRQNVAFALPEGLVSDEDIWQALERACLADFLRHDRHGLDTVIGEHGVKLSGGQRQRLGLARAVLTKPKLIILDEATSALDAETEEAVTSMIEGMGSGVTRLVVAHRLATVRRCDAVAYLSEGRLESVGTFDEVRLRLPAFDNQARLMGF